MIAIRKNDPNQEAIASLDAAVTRLAERRGDPLIDMMVEAVRAEMNAKSRVEVSAGNGSGECELDPKTESSARTLGAATEGDR